MAINYNPDPDLSNVRTDGNDLKGWYKSAGSLYQERDGARWVAPNATGLDPAAYTGYLVAYIGPNWHRNINYPGGKYVLAGAQVRRNGGANLYRIMFGQDSSDMYNYRRSINLWEGVFPIGKWITIPMIRPTGYTPRRSGGYPLFDITIMGGDKSDFSLRNFYVYSEDDLPTLPEIDDNDASFTVTTKPDNLHVKLSHEDPNEFVNILEWDWGDGTVENLWARENRVREHDYATAGTYVIKLTAKNTLNATSNVSDGSGEAVNQTRTTSKNTPVPGGEYNAEFLWQSEYLDVDVDGGPSITASDPDAIITEYRWDWGDGTAYSYGKVQSHSYPTGGAWPVTLRISNSMGQFDETTVSVTTQGLPSVTANFSFIRDLLDVHFIPTTSGGTYLWDFGDGNTSNLEEPRHTYAAAGTYEVTLTYTEDGISTTATKNVKVTADYTRVDSMVDVLRLEVETPALPGQLYNMLENPSGELGGYGWVTPTTTGRVRGTNSVLDDDAHGIDGWKLIFTSEGGEPQFFTSEWHRVDPGEYVSAAWQIPFVEGYYRQSIVFRNIDGVQIGESTLFPYTAASGSSKRMVSPAPAPVGTHSAAVKFYHYSTNAGANPIPGADLIFRRVMFSKAATSAALEGLIFTTESNWLDIIDSGLEIKTVRKSMDLGTLTCLVRDSSLDPALHPYIRPGQKVRLRAATKDENETTIWESIFSGHAHEAGVVYEKHELDYDEETDTYTVNDPNAQEKTVIAIVAYDRYDLASSKKEKRGVYRIQDLPYILEGKGIPFIINDSSDQVTTAQITSINKNASLVDQILITRDTILGYTFFNRNNVFVGWDRQSIPTNIKAVMDEDYYYDIEANFSTDRVINSVTVKWLRYTGEGNTEEIEYGPYEDQASIDEWGFHPETFTIQGIVENPVDIEAYANNILVANKTPTVVVSSVSTNILNHEDISESRALLDLYDLVRVRFAPSNLDQNLRIDSIEHNISLEKWDVTFGFRNDGAAAIPQSTPSPFTGGEERFQRTPYAYAYASNNWVLSGGSTQKVPLNTLIQEYSIGFNPATATFTINEDGLYTIALFSNSDGGLSGGYVTGSIRVNDVQVSATRVSGSDSYFGISLLGTLPLKAGDTVHFTLFHNQGTQVMRGGQQETFCTLIKAGN